MLSLIVYNYKENFIQSMKEKNIVVIGGGTGSFTILSGFSEFENINIFAIVPSTDSGGSSGRLRDEFGYLPVGDVRQCLVAMAPTKEKGEFIRELFMYRFDKGENGLKGHNFGNLFLTALTDILGDELKAIKAAQEILNIRGNVYPVSLEKCDLVAQYENGEVIIGESEIDEPKYPHDGRLRISNLFLKPNVTTYKDVEKAILQADAIVIGPGDLYTSILADIVVKGIPEALSRSKAKKFYVMNLVTKFGQTFGFTANDHILEFEKYSGVSPDYVFVNSNNLPPDILEKYRLQNDYPVKNDLQDKKNVISEDFLAREEIKTSKGDIVKRSLIRHDGKKVAKKVLEVLQI